LLVDRHGVFDSAIRWFTGWLPSIARQCIQTIFPRPFLPPIVIIKKLKPTWDEEFDNEKRIYRKLKPLQGHAIPIFYGEGRCDGTRAFLLSDVGGDSLYSPPARDLSKPTIQGMLKPVLRAVLELGVEPADGNPRNYHLVGDSVVVLDFEDTAEVDASRDREELADAIAEGITHWTVFFHERNSGQEG
jgi:hypothetical protein